MNIAAQSILDAAEGGRDLTGGEWIGIAWAADRLRGAVEAGEPVGPAEIARSTQDGADRVWKAPNRPPESDDEQFAYAVIPMVEGRARRNMLAQVAGYLLWHGLDPLLVLVFCQSMNLSRCLPAFHPRTVEEIVAWVVRRDTERLERKAAT